MYVRGIRQLFAFRGYVVSSIHMSPEIVQVILRRDRRFALACPACGTGLAKPGPRESVGLLADLRRGPQNF